MSLALDMNALNMVGFEELSELEMEVVGGGASIIGAGGGPGVPPRPQVVVRDEVAMTPKWIVISLLAGAPNAQDPMVAAAQNALNQYAPGIQLNPYYLGY